VEARPLVAVVDDDQSVRESLPDLLRELGFDVQAFASAEEFLRSVFIEHVDCLVLDIGMPGMNGLELRDALARRRLALPVVFITAQADQSMRVRVIAAGAVDCLFKPFTDIALHSAVSAAVRAS
jgi:FixJ family two-component response regulator